MKHKHLGEGGFTLIESIISFTILVVLIVAVVDLFGFNLASITIGKTRALGLEIANEQIEYLRDLPYDTLATINGPIYPPGTIVDDQYVTRNKINFKIHTDIDYVDDPYDGNAAGAIPGKPTDLYPYDYKRAQVTVYLKGNGAKVGTLTTSIGAKAAETSSNTGILSIKVVDANGNPVADATVHITNTNPNPDVDITTTTDVNGLVVIPKLPPDSVHGYHLVVSKTGYSSENTSADPPGTQAPTIPNLNVLAQQITSQTLSIDRVSTMTVKVVDTSGAIVASQNVTITGSKQVFTSPVSYKYQTTQTTDATGMITNLINMEWDSYSFTVPAGKYIVSASPYQPSALNPNSALSETLTITSDSTWPRITTVSPATDPTGTNPVTITVTGTNLVSGSTLVLKQTGQANITATGVSANGTTLTGALNLSGAATGSWDIVITKPDTKQTTQTGGFIVTP